MARRKSICCRHMRLELDGIGASIGDCVNEGVRKAERAVMGLSHFGNNEWTAALTNRLSCNVEARHVLT